MPAKRPSRAQPRKSARDDQDIVLTIRDSAQQIWLAGLGALAKTQEEGTKVFDALVEQGRGLEARTISAAQTRFGPAGQRLTQAATEATSRAMATWEWLEHAFEQRLAQTLKRVGAPTQADIAGLTHRLDALERQGSIKPRARTAAKRAASAKTKKASVGARRSSRGA